MSVVQNAAAFLVSVIVSGQGLHFYHTAGGLQLVVCPFAKDTLATYSLD